MIPEDNAPLRKFAGQARTVVEAIAALAFLWFCLWAASVMSDTHTKAEASYNILTALSSARDVQIDRRSQDNADNISANVNRLDALENKQ